MSITKYQKLGLIAGLLLILLTLSLAILLPVGAENPDLSNTYYTVNVVSNNNTYGTVERNKQENETFQYGTKVILTATPKANYRFVRWEGDGMTSSSNPLEFAAGDGLTGGTTHSYTAIFEPVFYAITYVEGPNVKYPEGTVLPRIHTYGTKTELPTPNDTTSHTFEWWEVESGGIVKRYEKGTSLGEFDFSGDITLTPHFEPRPFSVTIYDVPEKDKPYFEMITNSDQVDAGRLLNQTSIRIPSYYGAQNVSPVDPEANYYGMYRGYYFTKMESAYKALAEVTANDKLNFAIRYFTAKTYKIYYENCDRPQGSPEYHVYGGEGTTILTPTREGYTFSGWTILNWDGENYRIAESFTDVKNNLRIGPEDYDNPNWTVDNKDDREVSIILRAEWTVNVYDVDYEGVSAEQESALNKLRPYDQSFSLPNTLTRKGYTFIGWKIQGVEAEFALDFSIPASSLAQDVVIVAGWQANDYTVTLDPDAADATGGDPSVTATYDSLFPTTMALPTRDGYTFLGYFSDKNGRGKGYYYYDESADAWISAISDIATDDVTLYAYWRINSMEVKIDDALLGAADVTVNGIPYLGTPLMFDYNTSIRIVVTMKENYKLVFWDGQAIAHTRSYEMAAFDLKSDITLSGAYAEALATPSFVVNYKDEIFTLADGSTLPAGRYKLTCEGEEDLFFTVAADGSISIADTVSSRFSVLSYLGKTVFLTLCGDGTASADSDAQRIEIAARPHKPTDDLSMGDIDHISALDDSIRIVMNSNRPYVYEFAVSLKPVADGAGLTWTTEPLFENLKGGTPYYIYIRVAASETYPHGEVYQTVRNTLPDKYRQTQIDKLMDLGGQEGDGENVAKLLEDAKKAMQELQPSADFVDLLDEIYDSVVKKLAFARIQDKNIAALAALRDALKATGAYHEISGITALEQCYEAAKQAVIAATTDGEVQRIYANAEKSFYAIPITYLYSNDIRVQSQGMDREYMLASSRVTDLSQISKKVKSAVASGLFVVDSNCSMSLLDAEKALDTLDVLGFYTLNLRHKSPTAEKPNAPFEVRLLIPADLRDETGLLVAYQNDVSGLTILETRREGEFLIFTASAVADFVILGDHTVNLTWLLLALSITLLCQLVGIGFLLIRRYHLAKEIRNYSFAIPTVALTVRFLPENSFKTAIVLGVLVVIMQILLLWLLLRSDLIFRGNKNEGGKATKAQEKSPAAEQTHAESSADGTQSEEAISFVTIPAPALEEAFDEESDEMLDEAFVSDSAEEPDFAEAPQFEADSEEDLIELEAEDWYGDNSFTDPAMSSGELLEDSYEDAYEDSYEEEAAQEDTAQAFYDPFEENVLPEADDGAAYAYNPVEEADAEDLDALTDEDLLDGESDYVVISREELSYEDIPLDKNGEAFDTMSYAVPDFDGDSLDYAESEFDPSVYEADPDGEAFEEDVTDREEE